ncbi:lytic transglycosylase domain-containing protein [Yokenella regensburgei]|uniref:lytic transglycosylase domain-containing protein n=1 Tax=Yokenella regensburgei TaxID=158877 RepID=UPI001ADEB1FA|nr:lytic transglycosylase domain-containing protein [Yokenella regensburgei]
MAGNQLPVLTLDFDDEKIKALHEIADKFKAALAVGPGGFPVPAPTARPPAKKPEEQTGKKTDASGFDKFMKGLNKEAQGTLKTFTLINKTLGVTTSTLKGLFATTISWGTKIAALSVAGPFGYGLMARHVADQYRTAQGMNVTSGQMQAANNVYGTRISNAENLMQTLAAVQNAPNNPQYAGIMSLGINPQAGAAENMPKLLEGVSRLLQQYKGTGVSQSVLQGYGLDGVIDVATANQILANSDRLPQLSKQFAEQSQVLDRDMGSGTQQKYQDVTANFEYNADRIGNSFLKALAKLSGPIGKISDNLTASIEKFLNGKNGKAVFDTLANGLQRFGDWLGSDDFQNDLKTFADCVKVVIQALGDAIKWIAGHVPELKVPKSIDEARKTSYFMQAHPATATTPAVPAPTRQEATLWGLVKASGQTLGGIGETIAGNMFPDLSARFQAGGWANYDKQKLARGLRNNNPGNLNFAGQRGASMEGGPNGRFAVFPTMVEGVAALDRQLGLYMSRGKDTISQIVSTYAPGADKNNEAAYRAYLSRATGLGADEKIDRGNTEQVIKLIRGIIGMENGEQGSLVSNNDILAALALNNGGQAISRGGSQTSVSVQVQEKPGSDIQAQVQGIYVTPR